MISKIIIFIILNCTFILSTPLSAKSKVHKVDELISQSIDKDLYDINKQGRFITIELDRSLDQSYKSSLHQWLQTASQNNDYLNQVYITWRPQSFLLSNISSISFSLTIAVLFGFLFLSLKLLSKKSKNIDDESLVQFLVEEKVQNTLLATQQDQPIRRTIDYSKHLY